MHYFHPNVAAEYGITEAVIINHFQYWIKINKRKGINENDGRTWTYTTIKELSEWFDYLTEKQVRTAIEKLVEKGVLVKGNYNVTKYDRTSWYAFTLESFWIRPEGDFHFPRRANREAWEGEPIPNDSTNDKTDNSFVESPPPPPKQKSSTPRAANKVRDKAPDYHWTKWVDAWFDFVRAKTGTDPMFNGAQAKALKQLRIYLVKSAGGEEEGLQAWADILGNWSSLDTWIQEQLDLTVILKKINDIINQLRNGSQTNRRLNPDGNVKSGISHDKQKAMRDY